MIPIIIGLSGDPGVGKDTCADYLVDQYGFRKIAFADALRHALAQLNPLVNAVITPQGIRYETYNELVSEYGYDLAKKRFPEIRRLLRYMGTEVVRDLFGYDTWVDILGKKVTKLEQEMRPVKVVIPDVRFKNEAGYVHKMRGYTVVVRRSDMEEEQSTHRSDNELRDWSFSFVLDNDGDIGAAQGRLKDMMDIITISRQRAGYG